MSSLYHLHCRHPSQIRRALARLAFLSENSLARINAAGLMLQKIANTIRFEHFWEAKVRSDSRTKIVPSFSRSRSKHPIWDIALASACGLRTSGTILEFGTNNGGSLFYFSKHVPQTVRLVGFDCFEGIPEPWDSLPRGAIKGYGAPIELWSDDPVAKGQVLEEVRRSGKFPPPPQPNVSIEVGLFAESVPRFLRHSVPDDIILIHFDADIYMGTRPVLDSLCGSKRDRFYVLFDEFYSVNHEFRAWLEFVEFYDVRQWRVVAISEDGVQALFEVN
jgi:hypothetical protein